ncbi:putative DivIVA family protein [Actinoplanes missouriensis 431]|uniref:Cell wall synthesis protein Wag31 n=1 Tax=Actinoplanes missouriensis (strain ATCC 14538 / DSM 43046 / CBS 188.64 / JCM 3121 / NBRC 102363 / NCIMB 12654 / NRRL B-3342 / UNCC 431) TaxID=512565 RepID=I0H833_ACTM4|nr:DivIVA domain-containing protein [Actinoplanes missouriensis]BAL89170.1 putative DivIVA family protein [Actinoplanes missouriensis 431]
MTGIAKQLTPADVDGAAFRRAAPGSRGYHEGEVDAFLSDVAGEMRRLAAENRALRDRLGPDDPHARLHALEAECAQAQERVRALEAELSTISEPGPGAAGVVKLAARTADDYLADVRREAADLLGKATTEADRLISDAELRASTIVADARHRHAELMAALPGKRAAALDRIDALRAEADERRESITGEVSGRLQNLIGA